MGTMPTLWIVHRDPHHRNALAGLVAAGDGAVVGAPLDAVFSGADSPDGVVLGLGGDFEQELEFAHRFAADLRDCAWLLLVPMGQEARARRLFDTLDARHLNYPVPAIELRRALRDGLRHHRAPSLSSRRSRDLLRERFGRWFADLPSPEWMRALDPQLATVPILVRGEPGTGRGLLARYIHTFGGRGDEAFLPVDCRGIVSADELVERIGAGGASAPGQSVTIWLEEVDRLPTAIQRQLRDWIEFGALPGRLRGSPHRWMAGAADETELDIAPGLDPRLGEALSLLDLRIPPLSERQSGIGTFVAATAEAWFGARGQAPRHFSGDAVALLQARPWPGNLHELESAILRTLALTHTDPVLPAQIAFPSQADWLASATHPGAENWEDLPAREFPTRSGPQSRRASAPSAQDEELTSLMPRAPETETDAEMSRDILSFFEAEESVQADAALALDPLQRATDATIETRATDTPSDFTESRESELRRAIQAVAHAVRNPLVSIRTFAELLPERYDDPEFRDQFRELVGQDIARIDGAVTRLQGMVELPGIDSQPVDLAHLLDKLLDEHADEIRDRRLLVLKELDHGLPHAYGDPLLLRDAFAGLLEKALASVRDRGDIYLASKHHEGGRAGEPSVRVLLRYSIASPQSDEDPAQALSGDENLASIMAQTIVQSLGGALTTDTTDANECVIVIDLPAPGPE